MDGKVRDSILYKYFYTIQAMIFSQIAVFDSEELDYFLKKYRLYKINLLYPVLITFLMLNYLTFLSQIKLNPKTLQAWSLHISIWM